MKLKWHNFWLACAPFIIKMQFVSICLCYEKHLICSLMLSLLIEVNVILPLWWTVKRQNISCGCGILNGSQFLCSRSSTQVRSWGGGYTATHTLAGIIGVQMQLLVVPLYRKCDCWWNRFSNTTIPPVSLALIQLICQRKRKVVTLYMITSVGKLRLTKQLNLLSTFALKGSSYHDFRFIKSNNIFAGLNDYG